MTTIIITIDSKDPIEEIIINNADGSVNRTLRAEICHHDSCNLSAPYRADPEDVEAELDFHDNQFNETLRMLSDQIEEELQIHMDKGDDVESISVQLEEGDDEDEIYEYLNARFPGVEFNMLPEEVETPTFEDFMNDLQGDTSDVGSLAKLHDFLVKLSSLEDDVTVESPLENFIVGLLKDIEGRGIDKDSDGILNLPEFPEVASDSVDEVLDRILAEYPDVGIIYMGEVRVLTPRTAAHLVIQKAVNDGVDEDYVGIFDISNLPETIQGRSSEVSDIIRTVFPNAIVEFDGTDSRVSAKLAEVKAHYGSKIPKVIDVRETEGKSSEYVADLVCALKLEYPTTQILVEGFPLSLN